MKKLTIAIVMASLCPIFGAKAQTSIPTVGLKIGDKVPDITIDNIISYSTKSAKISDFKDKLLILDFWATSCGSCIENLPHLNNLQSDFKVSVQILPVSYESRERVSKFFKINTNVKGIDLPIVVEDTAIQKLFPHQLLPHVVWIYKGKYIQQTDAEYVTAHNIQQILQQQPTHWDQKEDVSDFNYNQPLLPVITNKQLGNLNPIYSAVLTGYVPGLPLVSGIVTDSITKNKRYYIINHSLLHLYALALNSKLPLMANRRIIHVADGGQLIYDKSNGYYTEWQKKNTFTYEAQFDENISTQIIKAALKSTLDCQFHLSADIRSEEVDCMVLHLSNTPQLITTHKEKLISKDPDGTYNHMDHIQIADLVYIINHLDDAPPLIDETGMKEAFDLNLSSTPKTFADWKKILSSQGFQFEWQKRALPMFILTGNDNSTNPLNK